MDGGLTMIFDASTDTQDGVGGDDFPIEFIGGGTFGGERLLIDLFADGTTSSRPMFNLIVFRGELDDALVTAGATRGHSATADAFSVAATPAATSFSGTPDGPYPGLFTAANESESFTSDGPRRIILSPTGVELTPGNRTSTGGVVRQKPDITAADGVSTAAPGFNPFYGTSAAAPHAAAIAALCKSASSGHHGGGVAHRHPRLDDRHRGGGSRQGHRRRHPHGPRAATELRRRAPGVPRRRRGGADAGRRRW